MTRKGRIGRKVKMLRSQDVRYRNIPPYGEVPFIKNSATDGKTWMYDPNYEPPMPAGAVRGDIREQNYCCDMPHYFYQDKTHTCVQCDQQFVFSAKEQKYWYEVLKFNLSSLAVRCKECRRLRRNERALQAELSDAVRAAKDDPRNPGALLRLAEATYNHAKEVGQGNLERGIGAARRAYKLAPELCEALYWEAACQDLAGRGDKAVEKYREFLRLGKSASRYRNMIRDARRRVPEEK